jgi:hypothetical protein
MTAAMPFANSTVVPVFSGLHVGAAIAVPDGNRLECGAAGVFLGGAGDDRPSHLLTAGHVFVAGNATGAQVLGALAGTRPRLQVGSLVVNFLAPDGAGMASLEQPIDIAVVELTRAGAELAADTTQPPGLEDLTGGDGDGDPAGAVRAYLWTRAALSGEARVDRARRDADFATGRASFYTLHGVFAATPPLTDPGDSGTALLSAVARAAPLGLCVGEVDGSSIIEPLPRALAAFRRVVGDLQLWTPL